jgi:Atrophied bacterial Ig domain
MPVTSLGPVKDPTYTAPISSTTEQSRNPAAAMANGVTLQQLNNWKPDGVDVSTLNSTQKLKAIQSILQTMVASRDETSLASSLPTSMMGATIAWMNATSNDISYQITLDGITVTQDANSALAFPIAAVGMTDAQAVARASEILTIGLGQNQSLQLVISNLALSTSGAYGTTISWSSSDTAHISNRSSIWCQHNN